MSKNLHFGHFWPLKTNRRVFKVVSVCLITNINVCHLGSFKVIQRNYSRNRMIYEDEELESSFGTVGSQLGTSLNQSDLGSDCRYHTYPRIRTLFSHKPYPSPITNTNPRPNPNKNELKVKAAKVRTNACSWKVQLERL